MQKNRDEIVEKFGNFLLDSNIYTIEYSELEETVKGILHQLQERNNMELFTEKTGLNDDDIELISNDRNFIILLRSYIRYNKGKNRQIMTGGTRRKRRSKKSRKSKRRRKKRY